MLSSLSSLFRRFSREERGASALEFAIVSVPFLWIVLAIFETGILFFTQKNLESSTNQAARLIRTGQADKNAINQTAFKQKICDLSFPFLDCTNKLYVDVRTYPSFAGINPPPALNNGQLSQDITKNAQYQIGGPSSIVVVRVYYVWDLFVPGISLLANVGGAQRLLSASGAFQNEPYL